MSIEIAQLQQIKNLVNKIDGYTPFSYTETITVAVIDTWETAYSVTGQGYLSNVLVSTNGSELRVTIDGTVIFLDTFTAANDFGGIVQSKEILYTSTGKLALPNYNYSNVTLDIEDALMVDNFDGVTQSNLLCILSEPIYFKESLLIEVQDNDSAVNIRYSGGYIA